MTEPKATRKNTDYSASAVKLCNPPEVEGLLLDLQNEQTSVEQLKNQANALIPDELKVKIGQAEFTVAKLSTEIRRVIDKEGSYQDIEVGWYALKQRKVSKSYKAEPFEKNYPQFAPAVIIKAIDTAKLTGLIKGGLINEGQLEADGVLVCTESFAYIIKV